MQTIDCPNCGAPVLFRTTALPVRVCDHCRTLVVRYSQSAETMGTVAELPFDVSPVQIGTRGEWEGLAFEIVGRMRWSWEDGAWNEWFLMLSDGSTCWLGEAMGRFMMAREQSLETANGIFQAFATDESVKIGYRVQIDHAQYRLADQRTVRCVAAEGELPFTAPSGWEMFSADFHSRGDAFACFQRDRRDSHLYVGRYVELADLKPQNLRLLPGWDMPIYD